MVVKLAGIKAKFENVKDCYSGNLEHKNAADKVRDAIELYAKYLPHIGEELPAKWINIRAEIEQAAEQQATISQQDYFKLYEKHLPFDRENSCRIIIRINNNERTYPMLAHGFHGIFNGCICWQCYTFFS